MNKNENKNKLIPELRFPEFENESEWEKDIVTNLVSTITPTKKLSSSNYFLTGIFPIIDQSKSFYCGRTNEADAVISDNLPLIIFGDHTCVLKLAKEPFAQGADGIKILKTKNKITPSFLYQFLLYNGVKQEGYKRHFSNLKEKSVFYPKKETGEQQKISTFLSSLDEVIAFHNYKLHVLKDHKKALLQNLFPQEGETVPKYRFAEFKNDGDWVKKKLGDKEVSSFVNQKTSIRGLKLNTYISTENMLPDFSGIRLASKLPSAGSFTKFIKGDILISNIRPYLKKVWRADVDGGASNDVIVFRAGSKVISEFLEFIIKNDAFINYVMKSAKGVKMPRGDKDSMQEYPVLIPSKKEQLKIASCLLSLHDLITAQTEKIEQLQLHKKGLMQGLFPKVD